MKFKKCLPLTIFCLLLASVLAGCASYGTTLRTESEHSSPPVREGLFTVFLIGGNYSDDVETVAILSPENAKFIFEPYMPAFQYQVRKNVPADKAFAIATHFAESNTTSARTRTSRILAADGSVIGYEVLPLFPMTQYGSEEAVDIIYAPKNDRVIVYIKIKPEVESIIRKSGDSRDAN